MLRGRFIASNAYVRRKEEISKTSNLTFNLRKAEAEKSKVNRRKEIIKNQSRNKQLKRGINKTNINSLKKINKMDKLLAILTKKKKTQIINIRNL